MMEKIELRYDEAKGEVFADDNSVLRLSRGNLAQLQREFEKVMGPAVSSIMYKSGWIYAQNVESNIKRSVVKLLAKISRRTIAEKMLHVFSSWGYGHAEFLELTTDPEPYAKLKVTNSANAMGYKNSKTPVCHFIRGVLAGAGSLIMDMEMYCLENKCVAKDDDYCEFEVITEKTWRKRQLGEK